MKKMRKGFSPRGIWLRQCRKCGKYLYTIANRGRVCNKCNHSNSKTRNEIPKSWIDKYSIEEIKVLLSIEKIKKLKEGGKVWQKKMEELKKLKNKCR